MRNIITSLLLVGFVVLAGCSGSDTYLGDWKATDANGDKYTLTFRAKDFSIRKAEGDSLNFKYTQNSMKTENSIKTYGLKLDDGRGYNMYFPVPKDASRCLMTMEDGKPVYALSRTSYLTQNEVQSLMK